MIDFNEKPLQTTLFFKMRKFPFVLNYERFGTIHVLMTVFCEEKKKYLFSEDTDILHG